MNLTYVTTKSYPATTADHQYIKELSKAFTQHLAGDFQLIVAKTGADIRDLQTVEFTVYAKNRTLSLFIFLFLSKRKLVAPHRRTVFLCNDFNIALIFILLRWIYYRNVELAFDAHMLSDTWKDRFVLMRMDKIITTSPVLKQHIQNVGIPEDHIASILGGITLDGTISHSGGHAFFERIKRVLPSEVCVIGYVGSFSTGGFDKGLSLVVDALDQLPQNVVAVFIGGSPLEINQYTKYVNDKGMTERCFLFEKTSQENVMYALTLCDVLVIPYPNRPHFARYGFPMKAYEYLLSGKPIVYSNLKIMHDVLKNHDYCFSFEADNVQSFAHVITELSKNKSLPPRDLHTLEKYSWHNKAGAIIHFLT